MIDRIPDWKVWKLRGGDFENLIVNIQKASKVRGGFSHARYKQGRSEGVLGGGGVVNPPTFVELTYSENRVGHSENYGNNSITEF